MPSATIPANTPQWPSELLQTFDPIHPLGMGGFGSVWMARRRGNATSSSKAGDVCDDKEVAIKLVGSGNKTSAIVESAYALWEATILSELSHPHIMRLIRAYGSDDDPSLEMSESSKEGKFEDRPLLDPAKPIPRTTPRIPRVPVYISLSLARGPPPLVTSSRMAALLAYLWQGRC